jgi:DNA polymerase bacteriophage-type
MSRWADLFAELSDRMTDGDTPRHTREYVPPVCRGVSPSVNGANGAGPLVSPANLRLDPFAISVRARTDDDPLRRTEGHAFYGVVPPVVTAEGAVFLDFETRNTGGCDLTRAGAWCYAADPATEILTLVYRHGGVEELWTSAAERDEPLKMLAADPAVEFVCFAGFEQAVWQMIMVERFGFAPIPVARWIDMQAVCSYLALPRSLGKVLPVIGAPVTKDMAGQRLVRSLSRPNRKTGRYPEVTSEIIDRVRQYNGIDVDGLIVIHAAAGELPERERRVWELDQEINRRGLGIDVGFVRAAKTIAEQSTDALVEEFAELTNGLSPHQVGKIREWLTGHGFGLGDLQEATVQEALDDLALPPDVRRVLEIRLVAASTSLKKLDAMLACVGPDGRARGLLQYHAATPGRWSGCLLQPQNLPRPTVEIGSEEIESVVEAVKTGDPESLCRWGTPVEVLASSLRYAVTAADGAMFGVGDFSMIETCVLLALAGQHDKCTLIASGSIVIATWQRRFTVSSGIIFSLSPRKS